MARADRAAWMKRVERWDDSGLSAKEFATELGVSLSSLKWWKWRLRAEANGMKLRKRAGRRRVEKATSSSATAAPMTFVEMAPPTARRAEIEVVLPSRIRIRIGANFEERLFERVLDVLELRK